MSEIQEARDVLSKWRKGALPGPWSKEASVDYEGTAQAAITTTNGPLTWDDHGGEVFSPETARLIVGTAGNPDMLDAIDGMLSTIQRAPGYFDGTAFSVHVQRIAKSIVSADERMRS